jgi:hypothetical protein
MEAYDNWNKLRPGPRVLTYINRRMDIFRPQLRTDIIKHCDVSLVTLYLKNPRNGIPHKFSILNVYNNGHTHAALHKLEEVRDNLPIITLCTGDFNIQDREWDKGAVASAKSLAT